MRYCVCLYTAEFLTGNALHSLILLLIVLAAIAGCAPRTLTLENTSNLTQTELLALCEDLQMRANMDCRWNLLERQSSVTEQQTWEINCRSRRDSAQESFDNNCQPLQLRQAEIIREHDNQSPLN